MGRGVYVCQHLSFLSNGKTTEGKSRSKPDPGNLAVRDCRGASGNMLHGLITICHEVGNDAYQGSYWPKTGVRYISISTVSGGTLQAVLTAANVNKECEAYTENYVGHREYAHS